MLGVGRHPQRSGHVELAQLGAEGGGLQLLADPLRQEQRTLGLGLFAEDAELFAAEARDDVRLPLGPPEDRAELLDHHVAGGVAVGVVDALEVVDVGDDEAQLAAEAGRRAELSIQLLQESALVEAAGEPIGGGHLLQATHGLRVAQGDGELVGQHLQGGAHGHAVGAGTLGGERHGADGVLPDDQGQDEQGLHPLEVGAPGEDHLLLEVHLAPVGQVVAVLDRHCGEAGVVAEGQLGEAFGVLADRAANPVPAIGHVVEGDRGEVVGGDLRGGPEAGVQHRLFVEGGAEHLGGAVEDRLLALAALELHEDPLVLEGAEQMGDGPFEERLFLLGEGAIGEPVGAEHAPDLLPLDDGHAQERLHQSRTVVVAEPLVARAQVLRGSWSPAASPRHRPRLRRRRRAPRPRARSR